MGKDVIIACDFDSAEKVFAFLDKFTGKKPFVKIGMELFYGEGPDIVREIKAMGYKYSTRASLSISVADMVIPEEKYHIVKEAEAKVDEIFSYYEEGELTDNERYNCVIDIWNKATNDVVAQIQQKLL